MKKIVWIFISVALILSQEILAQGFLNKIKSKANQELNKLENGATTKPVPPPNKNILSANVTRTVVATIGADENFDYQESCIDLGASLTSASFIVNRSSGNGMQCFAYKNGTRTAVPCPAPNSACQTSLQCSYTELKTLEEDELKKYIIDHTAHVQTPTYTDEQLKQMSAYMTKEQVDEVKKAMKDAQAMTYVDSRTINFKGKKYGPFPMIQLFVLSADGSQFYAVINEGGTHTDYKMITSASAASLTLALPPLAIFAASDNSEFGAYGVDINGQDYSIHTSTGKIIKIADPGYFQGAWYTSSGNHLVTFIKENVAIDGKVVKTFDANSSPKPCDIFVSSDAKGIAVVKDNTISFPDGDYFQYPIKMALINTAGKVYFKWLAMEDKQIVLYQKPF